MSNNIEIETRFLEIDLNAIQNTLREAKALDLGEKMLEEVIFYDKENTWRENNRFVRVRKTGDKIELCYKEHRKHSVDGSYELEVHVNNFEKTQEILEKIGLRAFRHQQKRRHTFTLDNVTIDIDTWPNIPTYLELEGETEQDLQNVAKKLRLDWSKAVFQNASWVIENIYHIPVRNLKYFTFDKVE